MVEAHLLIHPLKMAGEYVIKNPDKAIAVGAVIGGETGAAVVGGTLAVVESGIAIGGAIGGVIAGAAIAAAPYVAVGIGMLIVGDWLFGKPSNS